LSIVRFGHQSGPGERSGGLGTAKFHDFSVRVFLDMSQHALMHNIINFLGKIRFGDGHGMELNLDGQTWWCLHCHDGNLNHHGGNVDYHGGISSLPTQPPDTHP